MAIQPQKRFLPQATTPASQLHVPPSTTSTSTASNTTSTSAANTSSSNATPATNSALGIVQLTLAAANPLLPLVVGDNDPRLQAFVGAGGTATSGLVPNPGTTAHSPVWFLAEDAAFHAQTDIVNLGIVVVGTWQATAIGAGYGGLGAANTGASGKVPIGQGSTFTERAISGDATLSNAGALTLASSGVTAASIALGRFTVDSKGRLTAASNLNVVTKTTTYLAVATDDVIICDATTAAFTVTLPTAVGIAGKIYILKKKDATANAITVSSAVNIDGGTVSLSTQYQVTRIISDGTQWWTI